jgi:hypothetical protein
MKLRGGDREIFELCHPDDGQEISNPPYWASGGGGGYGPAPGGTGDPGVKFDNGGGGE